MNKRVDFVSGGYYILTDEEQQIYEICGDTWLDEYCRYISDNDIMYDEPTVNTTSSENKSKQNILHKLWRLLHLCFSMPILPGVIFVD